MDIWHDPTYEGDGSDSRALAVYTRSDEAASDEHMVALWLHGRPAHTQRAYRADSGRFLAFVDRSLSTVTVGDVQDFVDTLCASWRRRLRRG
jgi:hypothetical protein